MFDRFIRVTRNSAHRGYSDCNITMRRVMQFWHVDKADIRFPQGPELPLGNDCQG
jgi:hypothetical protein